MQCLKKKGTDPHIGESETTEWWTKTLVNVMCVCSKINSSEHLCVSLCSAVEGQMRVGSVTFLDICLGIRTWMQALAQVFSVWSLDDLG